MKTIIILMLILSASTAVAFESEQQQRQGIKTWIKGNVTQQEMWMARATFYHVMQGSGISKRSVQCALRDASDFFDELKAEGEHHAISRRHVFVVLKDAATDVQRGENFSCFIEKLKAFAAKYGEDTPYRPTAEEWEWLREVVNEIDLEKEDLMEFEFLKDIVR